MNSVNRLPRELLSILKDKLFAKPWEFLQTNSRNGHPLLGKHKVRSWAGGPWEKWGLDHPTPWPSAHLKAPGSQNLFWLKKKQGEILSSTLPFPYFGWGLNIPTIQALRFCDKTFHTEGRDRDVACIPSTQHPKSSSCLLIMGEVRSLKRGDSGEEPNHKQKAQTRWTCIPFHFLSWCV